MGKTAMFREIKTVCRDYYESKLEQYGDSPRGVDWADTDSQRLRFQILCEVDNLEGKKVHDVGCGLGHLVDFLADNGVHCEYVGSDISPRMIKQAKLRLPEAQFHIADILDNNTPAWMKADYVITSGLFNVKADNDRQAWQQFVEAMVRHMFSLARRGIAFNMMTSYVDYEDSHLFYLSPAEMLDFCICNLGRRVVIRHDYPLWEYTVYVYR
jgi:SAM-dependent methyltransferase